MATSPLTAFPSLRSDLKPGQPRLLAVDNPVVVPVGATVQVLVNSDDVIHDWAVPSLGLKKDATPGRTNETWFRADVPGVFYGMCSELVRRQSLLHADRSSCAIEVGLRRLG